MKSLTIDFSLRSFVHLEDKSVYDHNYYLVETDTSVSLYGNNILLEDYDECANILLLPWGILMMPVNLSGSFLGMVSMVLMSFNELPC